MKIFESILIEGSSVTTYKIKWEFLNTINIFIDNGIGEVSTFGEITFPIRENIQLVFTCKNEYSEKKFIISLLIPPTKIEKLR